MTDQADKLVISADQLMNLGVVLDLHGEDYRLVSVSKEAGRISLDFRMPEAEDPLGRQALVDFANSMTRQMLVVPGTDDQNV